MNVFIIIGILFVTLFVVVTLLEKSGKRYNEEETAKIAKWIWPLVGILLVAQLIKMMFFS